MSHALLPDLKQFLELDPVNSAEDDFLSMLLSGVESMLQEKYRIVLKAQVITYYFSGDGFTETLFLPSNVNTIISVTVDEVALSPDEYYKYGPNGIQLKTGSFSNASRNNIETVVTTGYTLVQTPVFNPDYPPVPGDLRLATLMVCEKLYNDTKQNRSGVNGYTMDVSQRATFYDRLPKVAELILNSYQILGV